MSLSDFTDQQQQRRNGQQSEKVPQKDDGDSDSNNKNLHNYAPLISVCNLTLPKRGRCSQFDLSNKISQRPRRAGSDGHASRLLIPDGSMALLSLLFFFVRPCLCVSSASPRKVSIRHVRSRHAMHRKEICQFLSNVACFSSIFYW